MGMQSIPETHYPFNELEFIQIPWKIIGDSFSTEYNNVDLWKYYEKNSVIMGNEISDILKIFGLKEMSNKYFIKQLKKEKYTQYVINYRLEHSHFINDKNMTKNVLSYIKKSYDKSRSLFNDSNIKDPKNESTNSLELLIKISSDNIEKARDTLLGLHKEITSNVSMNFEKDDCLLINHNPDIERSMRILSGFVLIILDRISCIGYNSNLSSLIKKDTCIKALIRLFTKN